MQTLMKIGKSFVQFRKSRDKEKNIASLKSDTGLALTTTRGKLEALRRHYQLLSKVSVECVMLTGRELTIA